jgi:hypothetical protein
VSQTTARNQDIRVCLSKTKWGSFESAQRALASLRKDNPGRFDSTVRPYACRLGKRTHFHLGHGL